MKEKRKFIRFESKLKVDYIVSAAESRVEKTGTTVNVCAGGLQLLTEGKLGEGSVLELKIFIPNASNPAHLKGVVCWSKQDKGSEQESYCSGIEFQNIEEDNKNTFLKFLCDLMYDKLDKQ